MPKAPSTRSKAASSRKDPISKPSKQDKDTTNSKPKSRTSSDNSTEDPKKPSRKDTGKNSHLYTDDNPSTTLHGTGFRDAETANNTLALVSKRSLTYQFQTVNTLYHRARNHPSVKKAKAKGSDGEGPQGINEALAIFKNWLDETYPASKAALRAGGGFKPLLSKGCVEKFLPAIKGKGKAKASVDADALAFAELYASLPKNRRLGNVLVDDGKPGEADWEIKRYEALAKLVPEGEEDGKKWEQERLWDGEGGLSAEHSALVAWAWSPVGERGLAKVQT